MSIREIAENLGFYVIDERDPHSNDIILTFREKNGDKFYRRRVSFEEQLNSDHSQLEDIICRDLSNFISDAEKVSRTRNEEEFLDEFIHKLDMYIPEYVVPVLKEIFRNGERHRITLLLARNQGRTQAKIIFERYLRERELWRKIKGLPL